MNKLHELTPCQKEYAAKHINLVYRFLYQKELPVDEYYDIVIFGYLSAVQDYDEKPQLSRYKFSTIAWRQMTDSLYNHYTYLNRPKRSAIMVSMHSQEGFSLDELLPDRKKNLQDTVSDRYRALELMSYLTRKEQVVVLLKADGYTYTEIAEKCGLTPDAVGSRFTRLRQRLSLFLSA